MTEQFCKQCGERLAPGSTTCPKCGASIKKGMSFCVTVLVAIFIVGILAAILMPNFIRPRQGGQFTQCQSNCKNIGTALEMYSTDNAGHYPDSLDKLTPDYLKMIPTCAGAGEDTYSKSYTSYYKPDNYTLDKYTFYCSGHNHKDVGAGPNYPQYNSTSGLTPR